MLLIKRAFEFIALLLICAYILGSTIMLSDLYIRLQRIDSIVTFLYLKEARQDEEESKPKQGELAIKWGVPRTELLRVDSPF